MRTLRSSGWEEIDSRRQRERQQKLVTQTSHRLSKLLWKKRATHARAHQCSDKQTLQCLCLFFEIVPQFNFVYFLGYFVAAVAETVNCHAAQIVWSRTCETEQLTGNISFACMYESTGRNYEQHTEDIRRVFCLFLRWPTKFSRLTTSQLEPGDPH